MLNYAKFTVDDHVIISKYENIFVKYYSPNWLKEVFIIKKVKKTVLQVYIIKELNKAEIVETFYEKELQKKNQIEFRVEKHHCKILDIESKIPNTTNLATKADLLKIIRL